MFCLLFDKAKAKTRNEVRMPNYDLNVILEANLSEAQLTAEKDAINTQIDRYEGEVSNLNEWGRTRFAYPINKKLDGHYLIYSVKLLNSEAPKAIEQTLRLRDNVMRALVVRDRPEWRTLKKPKKPLEKAAPEQVT